MSWKKWILYWISGFVAAPAVVHILRVTFGWHVVVQSYTITPFCSIFVGVLGLSLSVALFFLAASRTD